MENEIPICGDGWLAVFDLIAPRQLGLEIALLSHRFDYYVDEHFKTRKWTFGDIRIEWKKGENGTKEMQIFNYNMKSMPIPRVPVPKKVVGFKHITIRYIDQKVVDFLHYFPRTFASCGPYLYIGSKHNGALELIMLPNIWPLIKDNIRGMHLGIGISLHQMRQFVPSILSDCPSLRTFSSVKDVFPAFPSDDSANASDRQLVAKWLFSPPLLPDGAPKVLKYYLDSLKQWSSKIDAFKMAFANASSRANFIIVITFFWSGRIDSVVPFELINYSTGERLTLKRRDNKHFLLVRCPIARDEQKWTKWEKEEMIKCKLTHPFNRIAVLSPVH